MLKPHVRRLYLQVEKIAHEAFHIPREDFVLINVNFDLKQKSQENKDAVVLVNPKSFEGKPNKIGILTLEKDVEYYFKLNIPNQNSSRATVIIFWQTWHWYGTFAMVPLSLHAFFTEHREKDPAAPNSCSICLEEGDSLRTEYVFTCTHRFCIDCIRRLYTTKPCPLCRATRYKR